MNKIHTEIVIHAPKEVIWDILTDYSAYPEWNPFIVRVFGGAGLGKQVLFVARFKLAIAPVLARILKFEIHKKLSWGGPGVSWVESIFCAEHVFEIDEIEPGVCRFINKETMGGVVANTMWPIIQLGTPAYIAMNEALKERAEAAV